MTRFLTALILTFCLGGCALFSGTQPEMQTDLVTISAWVDFGQPAIIAYGRLQDCSPATPQLYVCKDHSTWLKIQAAAEVAHEAIQAAGPMLAGMAPDTGQIQKAYDAVTAAEAVFKAAPPTVKAP